MATYEKLGKITINGKSQDLHKRVHCDGGHSGGNNGLIDFVLTDAASSDIDGYKECELFTELTWEQIWALAPSQLLSVVNVYDDVDMYEYKVGSSAMNLTKLSTRSYGDHLQFMVANSNGYYEILMSESWCVYKQS